MKKRDYFLRNAIQSLNLHYSKPKHVSYYRLVLGKFLSPYSSNKELRILAQALQLYHNVDMLHIRLGLFMKVFMEYFGSTATAIQFSNYMKRYEKYVILD